MIKIERLAPYVCIAFAIVTASAFAIEPGQAIAEGERTFWGVVSKLMLLGICAWGAKVLYFYITGDESDRKKMRGELRAFGLVVLAIIIIDAAAGPYLKLIYKFLSGEYISSKIK